MIKLAPQHSCMDQFPVKDNDLIIGGITVKKLAQRVGKTPFYAYDRQLITNRVAEVRKNMPPDLKIHYALKANPMATVVQHMANIVDGFDLASAGEMKVALDTTMPSEQISMVGPGKRTHELKQDILADKMKSFTAEIGDLVVIYQAGAYGLTASPTAFLSQPTVEEVLV